MVDAQGWRCAGESVYVHMRTIELRGKMNIGTEVAGIGFYSPTLTHEFG